jgi:hypothetical protein
MKIARVFPRRTTATPGDSLAFIGDPPLFRPNVDEIHISCVFSWDRPEARRLEAAWSQYYPHVRLGGPAFGDPGGEFVPRRYLADGYTITSRGCPNCCGRCMVPSREGGIRTLPIRPGYIVQDNNLLACPRDHIEAVFAMLGEQSRPASFAGGLEAARIAPWTAKALAGLRVASIFTAFDRPAQRDAVERAVGLLRNATGWSDGKSLRTICCYVLVGYDGDTLHNAIGRLEWVSSLGATPFAMYWQPEDDRRRAEPPGWTRELKRFRNRVAMYAPNPADTTPLFADLEGE